MTRYVLVSDLHGDTATAGFPRYGDVDRALHEAVDYAIENKADFFIFGGDLITNDPKLELMLRCITMAQTVAGRLNEAGIKSYWIPGNHDCFESSYGTTAVDPIQSDVAVVVKEPSIIDGILFLPFTPHSHDYSPEAACETLALECDTSEVKLVVGHLNIEGIMPGSEVEDFPRGRNVYLPVDTIKRLFPNAIITNGHIHARQVFNGVHIIGSLVNLTRGELSNEPGFLVIDT